nr:1592_t:CDS:2 [Entrophospora candida]
MSDQENNVFLNSISPPPTHPTHSNDISNIIGSSDNNSNNYNAPDINTFDGNFNLNDINNHPRPLPLGTQQYVIPQQPRLLFPPNCQVCYNQNEPIIPKPDNYMTGIIDTDLQPPFPLDLNNNHIFNYPNDLLSQHPIGPPQLTSLPSPPTQQQQHSQIFIQEPPFSLETNHTNSRTRENIHQLETLLHQFNVIVRSINIAVEIYPRF